MTEGARAVSAWGLRPHQADADVISLTNEFTVGRERQCNLVLTEPHVSRKHATFLVKEDKLYLQDTGSANGTFVNGQRITVTVLKPGDLVRFDSMDYEVVQKAISEKSLSQRPIAQKSMPQKPSAQKPTARKPVAQANAGAAVKGVAAKPAPAKAPPATFSSRGEGVVIVNRSLREEAPQTRGPVASLVVSGGLVAGQRFTLNDGLTSIGREADCDITLNTRAVSSRHAEIECVNGGWLLRDCDSSNGTQHNGQRVTEAHLSDGDQLVFGDVELVFGLSPSA
ncbi:pSer/pThr/pTyr-binding forkhead associated (FHA) protein [Litorivivens lipolytica]|uniref:PSer/pThr/pTyr-binding forkhead associated (FHA) protein n=1 Tax=Litorivivens lipolytica TaxID=1524264 RepID=A0A7W4W6M6_9GAMM|nr:FHA domain-containing protein [Litorivivens lipolytica]MBB3048300.1 pSer/pThr/pTyr-binding forkhead associated (FHA) protein [Litorivivens lipolytica]